MTSVVAHVLTTVAPGGDGSPGDPYATANEAYEAEDVNLLPGFDHFFNLAGADADTGGRIFMDAWPTTGPGDTRIYVQPWAGRSDAFYDGDLAYSTLHYRHEHDGGNNLANIHIFGDDETVEVREVHIDGIQLRRFGSGAVTIGIQVEPSASGSVFINGNRIRMDGTGSFARAIRSNNSQTSQTLIAITNNLILGTGGTNCSGVNLNDASSDADVFNNTIIYAAGTGEDAIDDVSGVVTEVQNNVLYSVDGDNGSIECDLAGTVTAKNHNATPASADRGANGWDVVQADFAGYAAPTLNTGDYRPAASQTNGWGQSGLTRGDNIKVPDKDIRRRDRNTGVGELTAAGCFAAEGEGGSGTTVAMGQATETVQSFALTSSKVRGMGQAIETTSSFGAVAAKAHDMGQAVEAVGSFPLAALKARPMGRGIEVVSSFPLGSSSDVPMGQAVETVSSSALQIGKSAVMGLAVERTSGLALTASKERPMGRAEERVLSNPLVIGKALEVGQGVETVQAFPVVAAKARPIGQGVEVVRSFPILTGTVRPVGQAVEGVLSNGLTHERSLDLGQAVEVVRSFPLGASTAVPMGQAAEVVQAFALSHSKAFSVGSAIETVSSFGVQGEKAYAMGLAVEVVEAFPSTFYSGISVGQAVEAVSSFPLTHERSLTMGLALEGVLSFPLTPVISGDVVRLSVFDGIHKAELQEAINDVLAETVTVIPYTDGGNYGDPIPDNSRISQDMDAKFSSTDGLMKLDGSRRGGELSGSTNISTQLPELWVKHDIYDGLGYELRQGDRIVCKARPGKPMYIVSKPDRGPHRQWFCQMVIVGDTE